MRADDEVGEDAPRAGVAPLRPSPLGITAVGKARRVL